MALVHFKALMWQHLHQDTQKKFTFFFKRNRYVIKESTRKTEEKLDGRNKDGHERKKPK